VTLASWFAAALAADAGLVCSNTLPVFAEVELREGKIPGGHKKKKKKKNNFF
jgi:hypothetical protein